MDKRIEYILNDIGFLDSVLNLGGEKTISKKEHLQNIAQFHTLCQNISLQLLEKILK